MPEITKTTPRPLPKIPNYVWILLALLTAGAYLSGLWLPLVGPDEPRYAQVAREMLERGDWITPTLGGHPWFEKPPLLYWLQMAAYKVFGVNEFAARLGPALFGVGTAATLWILARTLVAKSADSTREGAPSSFASFMPPVTSDFPNWTAFIAASTLGILVFSHGASFDIIITFPVTAALVSFCIYENGRRRSDRSSLALVLFYVFTGVALLAKGLIGIVFPFGIVAVYFLLSRELPARSFVYSLLWGTFLALAVAAVWYVPVYMQNGWPFIDEFFIQHHFQRFLSNKYQHPQPFYFFLWVLPLMLLPWLPFFFVAVVNLLRRTMPSPLITLCAAWIAVPLIFFSLSGSKLPGYIVPVVPPAIIITAISVYRLSTASRAWRVTAISVIAITLAGTIVLSLTVAPRLADAESVKRLIAAVNERGMSGDRVFGLHNVPHGAEFYAAGRLLRDADGKQKRLYSVAELKSEMERAAVTRSLTIVPVEAHEDLTKSKLVRSEFIADNGELAIYAVYIN